MRRRGQLSGRGENDTERVTVRGGRRGHLQFCDTGAEAGTISSVV